MNARLQPGQTAPGIIELSEKKHAAAQALKDAVVTALADPKNAPPDLIMACQSQKGLVAWCQKQQEDSCTEVGKKPSMSLNTLKTHLNNLCKEDVAPGQTGFQVFWAKCQELTTKAALVPEKHGVRDKLNAQIGQMEVINQRLINDIMAFSHQYLHLLKTCREMAAAHPELQRKIEEHYARYPDANHGFRVIQGGKSDGE